MKYCVTLKIQHETLAEEKVHTDVVEVENQAQLWKKLNLDNECICELKNYGRTFWEDQHGAIHTLEITQEA